MHCAKNIRMTLQYFDVLLYKTFLFSFDLGFDIGSDSCTSIVYCGLGASSCGMIEMACVRSDRNRYINKLIIYIYISR